jgi:hypothetical protein
VRVKKCGVTSVRSMKVCRIRHFLESMHLQRPQGYTLSTNNKCFTVIKEQNASIHEPTPSLLSFLSPLC